MKAFLRLGGWLLPKKKRQSLLILLAARAFIGDLCPGQALAQTNYKVTGTVVSRSDSRPLPGALIAVDGQSKYTTDQQGRFSFSSSENSAELRISYIGFKPVALKFSRAHAGPFNIQLEQETSGLKEVVVSTGYQTLPLERATGSFSKVDNQLLNRRISTDVLSRLEGVVPGLLFNRNTINGSEGQVDISIRGHNTLFANDQPLIVINGFPYDGDLSSINPNDIESITVLKDAAAASIWGVRSGNGVIVLTTKKGQANQKMVVELQSSLTTGDKPDLYYNRNFLPAKDFIGIEKDLFSRGAYDGDLSAGYLPVSPVVSLLAQNRAGTLSTADLNSKLAQLAGYDVRDDLSEYFYRKSLLQQYAVNLKGGSDKSDYYFSLGDDHNLSNLTGNQNNRVTVNSSFNFYPAKNLTLTAQINYVRSTAQNNSDVQNITMGTTGSIYPYAKLVDANGNALPVVKDYATAYTDTAGHGKFLNWQYLPYADLNNVSNTSVNTDNRISLGLSYKFLKFLSADVKYQYENANTDVRAVYNQSSYYARNLINEFSSFDGNGNLITPLPSGGILNQSANSLVSNRVRGQLNFNNNWNGRHELAVLIGAEVSDVVNQGNSQTVYGFDNSSFNSTATVDYSTSFVTNPDGSSRRIPNSQSEGKATDRYISYFSNAGYTFNDRYNVSASARIDRSNLFGVQTNQKDVPLYSFGGGWNLSKEAFYNFAWITYLKLRATAGYTGNINKNATAVTTIQQFGSSTYSGLPYAQVANPGNPDLRWEKIRIINIGLDFGTRGNRLGGSFEYYTKKGTDLFGYSAFAPSAGITTFFGNTADISGNGLDIVINSQNVRSGKFLWTSNFLLTHVLDKVTKYTAISNSSNYILNSNSSTIFPLAGKSLYGLYSYAWAGLTHDSGNPQGILNGKVSTDYDAIISGTNIQDMVYNGSSRPTTFGSFRNTFSYGNMNLSFNLIYKLDYYFRRSSFISSGLPYSGNQDYFNRWQHPGDELKTNVPSLEYPPYTSNRDLFYQYSSELIDKGDHIRLQDISVGYDFMKKDFPGLPFTQLRVSGYINNVGIIWRANHDGLDPDLSGNTTVSNYPQPRTFSLGLKATL